MTTKPRAITGSAITIPDQTMAGPSPETACAVLRIDLDAIVANWRLLGTRHPDGPVAGVVKADAYGLGAGPVTAALYRAGCRHFFVAQLNEALAIRSHAPEAMIGVLSGVVPGTETAYLMHGITPVLCSLPEIEAWQRLARRNGRALSAMVQVDTGMHRLGLSQCDVQSLRDEPMRLDGLEILYVLSHLVASEEPADPKNVQQVERLAAARRLLPPAPVSFANSSGVFLGARWGSDLARGGAALYGINPTPEAPNPMRPVVRLMARVLAVRDVPTGDSVGYNGTWSASRPSRIAVAGIGYADGLSRALSNKGRGYSNGRALPLVGRVSMDLTTFDATDHPDVAPGDWLEIIGPHQTLEAIARVCDTNAYEVLTSLGRRFARVYHSA
ncbi:MAG: alanine racemase [Acetobacteraceae bacterium]